MITVILNPVAGASRHENMASHLAELFGEVGIPVHVVVLKSSRDAVDAGERAAREGDDAVVAAGGDGTVSTVASSLAGSEMPMGVLPLGTLNHFARDLKLPLNLGEAVKTIAARRTIKVDVGEVNGRTFLNNSSIGIYPDVVMEREALQRQGYRKLTAFIVATAKIVRHHRGLVVKITAENSDGIARTPFLLVGNNEYQTEGIHLGARTRLNGGQLSAYLAPRVPARELPKLFTLALAGQTRRSHIFESFVARELQVETPGKGSLRIAIDGEVARIGTPLRYRIRPLALRVIVP